MIYMQKKQIDLSVISNCTGCSCCANICPYDAITMQYDDNGYLKPNINKNKCINCGKCLIACPSYKERINNNFSNPLCYAAWAKNDLRYKSSSGGFFTVLSNYVLSNGGVVYGAVLDKEFCCHIIEADNVESLSAMRGSKYVQSRTDFTFRKVIKRLKEGRLVAYFGCPCQIAGLTSYISKCRLSSNETDNLITVDLICFYAPSNELFCKYLDEEFGIHNVNKIHFRAKS